jgi:predicted CxxxxCH...CXXCH cytochrome family protein
VIKPARRTPPSVRLALLSALALVAAGCSTARNDAGTSSDCTSCHGSPGNPAPPRAVNGDTATTSAGVGAHQAHLTDSALRKAIGCEECHLVPTSTASHPNGLVNLTFGPLARTGGVDATWTPAGATCANYCHGASLTGGSLTSPVWTRVDGTQAACGTCHGAPPPSPHPSSATCNTCHPLTVTAGGAIDVAGGHHMNGVVEASSAHGDFSSPAIHGPKFFEFLAGGPGALQCTSCHGASYDGGAGPSCNACHASAGWTGWTSNCSFCHGTKSALTQAGYDVTAHPTWAAPPDAVAQRLDPAHAPVPDRTGAHQAHLTGKGSTSGNAYVTVALSCATCHVVPADLTHAGGTGRAPVALVASGALATNLGGTALGSYDQAAGTCTTYCHGSTLGGTVSPPAWAGAELGCTGCHGNPPASGQHAFHVTTRGFGCSTCHTGTVDASNVAGPNHLDGKKDVVFFAPGFADWNGAGCTAQCHTTIGTTLRLPW